ncbi:MAG TPA: NUDIX hydrolase [Azospirillaceae bacterium]|nr:NUDIX hydrolase [Azospirillaceae bacterium]
MSRQYPDRPWVGVGVVVFRGDHVLLVRRGREPRKGQWGLPGGAQEVGETLFDCAVREVLEETGLHVRPYGVVTAIDSVTRDAAGAVRFHYTIVEVAAECDGGDPVPGDDADAARWVSLEEAGALVEWGDSLRVIELAAAGRRATS